MIIKFYDVVPLKQDKDSEMLEVDLLTVKSALIKFTTLFILCVHIFYV